MKIIFSDLNPDVSAALAERFSEEPNVEVHNHDIFQHEAEAIVSPANSFGFMDGGIDLVYSKHFGFQVEAKLQKIIADRFQGELLVGQATIVSTDNVDIPWMISAPTMRVPMHINGTVNVYLAFRAALRIAVKREIKSILSPGLGTLVGHMDPKVAAAQMLYAYNEVIKGHRMEQPGVQAAYTAHHLIARGII